MKPCAIKVLRDSAIVQLAGQCWRHTLEIRPDGESVPVRQWRVQQKSSASPLQVATTEAAVPAVRHPATDGTQVVMDARVMSPVQLRRRRKVNETYRLPRICVAHGIYFGITDHRFMAPLHQQLVQADGFGGDGVEFAASLVQGKKPRDHLEILLAVQTAGIHWATMKCLGQVGDRQGTVTRKPPWPWPRNSRELL